MIEIFVGVLNQLSLPAAQSNIINSCDLLAKQSNKWEQ